MRYRQFFVQVPLVLLLTTTGRPSNPGSQRSTSASPPEASGPSAKTANDLRARVASGRLDDLRWPNFSDYRVHLENFYKQTAYELAWVRNSKPIAPVHSVIGVLQQADNEGLNAEDYDGPKWPSREALLEGPHSPADEVRFDLALTVCAMRYASSSGRYEPATMSHSSSWKRGHSQ